MEIRLKSKRIAFEDCQFYTVQDIPGLNEPTKGEWDLRDNVGKYLGDVDFNERTVLELGPASGYLTFEIESRGASVTSIELSLEKDKWDVVPLCTHDWKNEEKEHREQDLQKVQNSYWFAHNAFNSNARVVYSHINDITPDIGLYDISVMGSVLLHLQNPFLALQNMLCLTKEKLIVTDLLSGGNRKVLRFFPKTLQRIIKIMNANMGVPYLKLLPGSSDRHMFAWWIISPGAIVNIAKIFGFEKTKVSYHVQYHNGNPIDFYTAVCERTIPIEKCNYKSLLSR